MTFVADDVDVAERALAEYDLPPDSTLRLLNLSENATYAVEDADTGARSILRVHRKNYHRPHEIESELDWLDALRRDGDVTVPTVLPARDGRRVVTVDHDGTARHVVHFEMVAGAEPDEKTLTVADFHTLGRHHGRAARPLDGRGPARRASAGSPGTGSTASAITRAGAAGRTPPGWASRRARLLGRASDLLQRGLAEYGTGPERVRPRPRRPAAGQPARRRRPTITVIDFDDCGFGWYFYDFGTAVSFFEDDPARARVAGRLGHGLPQPAARCPPPTRTMLPSFVLLRRLLLLAWMGTHSHSKESQAMSISYAEGSCALAERYLSSNGRAGPSH